MHSSMMTGTEILKAMVDANGHIRVLNGPTAEHITVCRSDGSALLEGDLPREILDDFHHPAGFLAYFSGLGSAARCHKFKFRGGHVVVGCPSSLVFGPDIVLDEMKAGALFGCKACSTR